MIPAPIVDLIMMVADMNMSDRIMDTRFGIVRVCCKNALLFVLVSTELSRMNFIVLFLYLLCFDKDCLFASALLSTHFHNTTIDKKSKKYKDNCLIDFFKDNRFRY